MNQQAGRRRKPRSQKNQENHASLARVAIGRAVVIGFWAFLLTVALNQVSETVLTGVGLGLALFVLLVIVAIGVVFDLVGVAVTASGEVAFHAMAADRVTGATQAIRLVRHADRVAAFCNDLVGDISGTVSGAAAAGIVYQLVATGFVQDRTLTSLFLVGLVAALTVGGKAGGKFLALRYCREITFTTGRALALLERYLGLRVLTDKGQTRRR